MDITSWKVGLVHEGANATTSAIVASGSSAQPTWHYRATLGMLKLYIDRVWLWILYRLWMSRWRERAG